MGCTFQKYINTVTIILFIVIIKLLLKKPTTYSVPKLHHRNTITQKI